MKTHEKFIIFILAVVLMQFYYWTFNDVNYFATGTATAGGLFAITLFELAIVCFIRLRFNENKI